MADPHALKPADHPFACLLLLENGIYGPNVKASLFCEYVSMDDQRTLVADTAADSL